jgi:hypothetical protein
MSGSTFMTCDAWATLNVPKLQEKLPTHGFEPYGTKLKCTDHSRINFYYMGVFISLYQ